ncbi:MAG: TGS domain-containing protein, partial [Rhodospirillales bacterium]
MVAITLPDGSVRQFDGPVTGLDVAANIGPGLAKAALAVRVDGVMKDLEATNETEAKLAIVTSKDDDALDLLRHDCAHVLAEAVQELYPGTQVTIGPTIENGFYYDFARDEPFSSDDLEKMEQKMHEIIDRDTPFVREVWDRDVAIRHFEGLGEKYKAELIQGLPEGEDIGIYRQGEWLDLCRGPHLPSTGRVGHAFKLMKVAGAYWRGDHRNEMLQRIYGTCWFNEKDLNAYLHMLEEAEK